MQDIGALPCGPSLFMWSNGSIHLKVQRFFKRIGSGDSVLSFLGAVIRNLAHHIGPKGDAMAHGSW